MIQICSKSMWQCQELSMIMRRSTKSSSIMMLFRHFLKVLTMNYQNLWLKWSINIWILKSLNINWDIQTFYLIMLYGEECLLSETTMCNFFLMGHLSMGHGFTSLVSWRLIRHLFSILIIELALMKCFSSLLLITWSTLTWELFSYLFIKQI